MKRDYHRLLNRQLAKCNFEISFFEQNQQLLQLVSSAYKDFDKDFSFLESILENSSKELFKANKVLKDDLAIKNAELKSAKNQLENVVNNIREVLFQTDNNGHLVFVNSIWEQFTGFQVNESLLKSIDDFLIIDLPGQSFIEKIKNQDDHEIHGEFQVKTKCGAELWVDLSAKLSFDRMGNAIGSIGSMEDVTEKRTIRNKLVAREATLNSVFNSSEVGVLAIDQSFRALVFTKEMVSYVKKRYGTTLHENVDVRTLVSKDDEDKYITYIKKAFEGHSTNIYRDNLLNGTLSLHIIITPIANLSEGGTGCSIVLRDITYLKKKEVELRLSEKRYRELIDLVPGGVLMTGTDGKINFASEQTSSIMKIPINKIVGQPLRSFFHRKSKSKADREWKKIIEGHGSSLISFELATPNGDSFFVESSGKAIKNQAGEVTGVIMLFQEADQKIKAAKALKEREVILNSIIESTPSSIFVLDRDMKIRMLNSRAKKKVSSLHNVKIDIGSNLRDAMNHNDSKRLSKYVNLALKGTTNVVEFSSENSPGVIVSAIYAPMISDDGSIDGVLNIMRDISSEKLTERTLKATENRYQKLVDTMPGGISVVGMDGTVEFASLRANDIFDLPSNKLVGSSIFSYFSVDQHQKMTEVFSKLSADQKEVDVIVTYNHPNGNDIHIQGLVNFIRDADDKRKYLIAFMDITDRVNAQIELDKSQLTIQNQLEDLDSKNKELESYIDSNLQLENFAYIASHDLKAPLRTVNSFGQLLKQVTSETLSDKAKDYLDIILGSTQTMQILIDDLLTFSMINTKEQSVESIDLNKLLDFVLLDLDGEVEQFNTSITVKPFPKKFNGDHIKLRQLFSNLLANAIKFSSKVKTPKIRITHRYLKDSLKVSISDNGIGIRESDIDEVFDIFTKLHSNDVYQGTGLGLTICKRVVEQHQGKIWVESEYKKGTTIHLTLSTNLKTGTPD